MRRIALLLASTLALVSAATFALTHEGADAATPAPVDVMFVGNNKETIIKSIPVGDHPQRIREGKVDQRTVAAWRS